MRGFLKYIYKWVRVSVQLKGWIVPSTFVVGVVTPIKVFSWSEKDLDECNWNSRGINVIFMAISSKEFNRMPTYETAKYAWNTLETTHERYQDCSKL